MDILFGSVTAWWQLLLIILIPLGLVGAIITIWLYSKNISIEREGRVFRIKGTGRSKATEQKFVIPGAGDIVLIVSMATEVKDKEDRIRFKKKLDEQMNYAKQILFSMKRVIENIYVSLLSDAIDDKDYVTSQKDYYFAMAISEIIYADTLELFRLSFEENHFDRMSEMEFEQFILAKSRYIANNAIDRFNAMYKGQREIARATFMEKVKEEYTSYIDDIKSIYHRALQISLQKEENIRQIQKGFRDFMARYVSPADLQHSSLQVNGCADGQ